MNCANHPGVGAVAYCRTCGKPVCEQCKRDVRGVIYCEDCLASRVEGTLPPTPPPGVAAVPVPPPGTPATGPNPVVATLLGFIPGVGAIYNGQVIKGLVHVLIFAGLIAMSEHVDLFGVLVAFFYCYMVWDAYATAKAIQEKRPLPDPFGLSPHLPATETGTPQHVGPGTDVVQHQSHFPRGAIILIGLGVLFLLQNLGMFEFHWVGRMWPLILIVIGLWLFARRSGRL